jgi:glyoxylase-like metal-dependent hydrolase (beta-lactamase superfamily II)
MQQLFDGVFLLEGEVGGRPLQILYLRGESASILWDTGCASDPPKFIAPQIREAGGDPATLTWIINSHPDVDHTGGNHAMKQIAPSALLACGDANRAECSSGADLIRLRYEAYHADHQMFYTGATLDWLQREAGQPQPVEVTFTGGERLRLGDGWDIEIVSLPGHAKGHLGLLDRRHAALYGGDAIQGSVYLGLDGQPKLAPTYLHVDDYLNTARFIEHLPITTYVGCHWPIKRGAEIAEFCAESRAFVQRADELLLEALRTSPALTLRDLCLTLGPALGDWPHTPDLDSELVYALHGHVSRLLDRRLITAHVHDAHPRRLAYALSS